MIYLLIYLFIFIKVYRCTILFKLQVDSIVSLDF